MYERNGIHEVEQRHGTDMGQSTEVWRLLAEQLEPRMEELTRTVEGLRVAPYNAWLADTRQACDPIDELRVKVEALQWIFRVAKHLEGTARDRVITTVCKSADDLEIALQTQLHASAVRVAA